MSVFSKVFGKKNTVPFARKSGVSTERKLSAVETILELSRKNAEFNKNMMKRSFEQQPHRQFLGSMTNVSNPAVMAQLMAQSGALDPKVAFQLGAPAAPNGKGQLVGIGGYKG